MLDDNATVRDIVPLLFSEPFSYHSFRKSYESFIYPFNTLFSLCILIYSYKISSLPNNIFDDSFRVIVIISDTETYLARFIHLDLNVSTLQLSCAGNCTYNF